MPLPSFPGTEDGLKQLLEAFVQAASQNDMSRLQELCSTCVLPQPRTTFATLFGEPRADDLASEYQRRNTRDPWLLGRATQALVDNWPELDCAAQMVASLTGIKEASALDRALAAMDKPVALGLGVISGRGDRLVLSPWLFVDGAWRYLRQLTGLLGNKAEALQESLNDLVEAVLLGDREESDRACKEFVLPDPKGWLCGVFDERIAGILLPDLEQVSANLTEVLWDLVSGAARDGCTEVSVTTLQNPYGRGVSEAQRLALLAARRTLALQEVSLGASLGCWVYEAGRFRFVGQLEALEQDPILARTYAETAERIRTEGVRYEATAAGLLNELRDLVHLAGMDQGEELAVLLESLPLPDRDGFCRRVFGEQLAKRAMPGAPKITAERIRNVVKAGLREVSVWEATEAQKDSATILQLVALRSKKEPLQLYTVGLQNPDTKAVLTLLSWVWEQGAWRWVGEFPGFIQVPVLGEILDQTGLFAAEGVTEGPVAPTLEGLEQRANKMLHVARRGDELLLQALVVEWGVPEPDTWFPATLGESEEAVRAQEYYRRQASSRLESLKGLFLRAEPDCTFQAVEIPEPASQGLPYVYKVPRPVVMLKCVEGGRHVSSLFPMLYLAGAWRLLGDNQPADSTQPEEWLGVLTRPA